MVERRIRWGDSLDEDDSIPPRSESIDADGLKTVIEYSKDTSGKIIRSVTKSRLIVERKKIYEVRNNPRKEGLF